MPAVNPCCIGRHIYNEDPDRPTVTQDAYISAFQAFCLVVACFFGLIISHWMSVTKQSIYPDYIVLHLGLVFVMAAALVVMFVLWRAQCARALYTKNSHIPHDLAQRYYAGSHIWFKQKIRQILPIIGIVLFFILGSFLDILEVAAITYCLNQYIECGGHVLGRYIANIIFNVTRFTFMGVSMLFCYVFHNRQMAKCAAVNYGLLGMLAALLIMWFYTTIGESNGVFNDNDTVRNNCTDPRVFEEVKMCIHEANTQWNYTVKESAPYLYAIHIEYLLLVMEMVCRLFCLAQVLTPRQTRSQASTSRSGSRASRSRIGSTSTSVIPSSSQMSERLSYRKRQLKQVTDDETTDEGATSTVTLRSMITHSTELESSITAYETAFETPTDSIEHESYLKTKELDKLEMEHNRENQETTVKQLVSTMHEPTREAEDPPPKYRDIQPMTKGKALKDGRQRHKNKGRARQSPNPLSNAPSTTGDSAITGSSTIPSSYSRKHRRRRARSQLNSYPTSEATVIRVPQSIGELEISQPGCCCCFPGAETTERQPLLDPKADQINTEPSKACSGPVIFLLALLQNLVFIVCGFLTYKPDENEDKQIKLIVYCIARILYWIPAIMVCSQGFHVTRGFESKKRSSFHGLEMMVFMSTVGLGMYAFFVSQASVCLLLGSEPWVEYKTSHEVPDRPTPVISIIAIIDTILNVVQVFLQTAFLAHALQIKPPEIYTQYPRANSEIGLADETEAEKSYGTLISIEAVRVGMVRREERKSFLNILVYLLICNVTLWLMDSFVDMKNMTSPSPAWYFEYERWEIIAHVTIPLALFYRFNSFILFTEVYLDH